MSAPRIVYSTTNYYVVDVGRKGFEVYRNGVVASERVARIGRGEGPTLGFERAKAEADRRERALGH